MAIGTLGTIGTKLAPTIGTRPVEPLGTTYAPTAPPAPAEQTVPRHLVHRLAISEVLLTGWLRESADTFALRAQLPRAHSFYDTVDGHHDPLLLAEAVRQAGLLISHAELGVPHGHQFLMHSLSLECDPEGLWVDAFPADLELRLTCHDLRYRRQQLAGMAYHVHLYRAGAPIGSGKAHFDCLSPAAYGRLRRPAQPSGTTHPLGAPLPPVAVGRDRTRDVVLAATDRADTWELRVDRSHPVLFDHDVDHVPGMLLIESFRQAAWCAADGRSPQLLSLRAHFHRYAELDSPCLVHAEATAGGLALSVTQDGTPIASGQVSTRD